MSDNCVYDVGDKVGASPISVSSKFYVNENGWED